MSGYDTYQYALPTGTPYTSWGEWAALIMSAIDVELANEENWLETDRPNLADNITELYYILPLLASCVAALEDIQVKIFLVRHKENQNVAGGDSGNDVYNVHPLNDEIYDPDGLVSLSGGNAIINAGVYLLIGMTTAYRPNGCHAALYDVSAAARIAFGNSQYSDTALAVAAQPVVVGVVNVSTTKEVRLEVWTQTLASGNGLGTGNNKGAETYAWLLGLKLA